MNQRSYSKGRGPQSEGPNSPRGTGQTPPPLNRRREGSPVVPPPLKAGRGWARDPDPQADAGLREEPSRHAMSGGDRGAAPPPPFTNNPTGPRGTRAGQRDADLASELAFTRGDLVRARSESESLRGEIDRLQRESEDAQRRWHGEIQRAREEADQASEQFRSQEQAHAEAMGWQDKAETLQAEVERLNAEIGTLKQQIEQSDQEKLQIERDRDEADSLRKDLAAAKDDYVRANAEMENVRRRSQEEVAKAHKYGIESFAESLVPVADSLEMALKVESPSIESLRDGVQATLRQLQQAFAKNRLSELDPTGQKFDPNLHQAISMVPAAGVPANHVASVLQKGYRINDRVLRPALVTVSQGS